MLEEAVDVEGIAERTLIARNPDPTLCTTVVPETGATPLLVAAAAILCALVSPVAVTVSVPVAVAFALSTAALTLATSSSDIWYCVFEQAVCRAPKGETR